MVFLIILAVLLLVMFTSSVAVFAITNQPCNNADHSIAANLFSLLSGAFSFIYLFYTLYWIIELL